MITNRQSSYINAIVFVAGFATLTVEVSAARLLGVYFGSDNFVWTTIIGLILLYLAVGFYVGGCWADRTPALLMLYRIAVWGAVLSGVIPLVGALLLPVLVARNMPEWITVIAAVSVFAVPVGLLGCLSPFALRLVYPGQESAGQSAGTIYAVSTLGSMLGSLLPVLVLLPNLGTVTTYFIAGAALLAVGLVGMLLEDRRCFWRHVWMILALLLVLVLR